MKLKRILSILTVSAISLNILADTYTISSSDRSQIEEEAEDWIDDMMPGLQDRLSDAVNHAVRGFYSEIYSIRNMKDTTGIWKYEVDVKECKIGENSQEIPVRIYNSKQGKNKEELPVFLFFHGGGWSMGSLDSSDKFCRALASKGNLTVVSVDYPLAPEHTYPAGVNICKEAINYLSNHSREIGCGNILNVGGEGAAANIILNAYEQLPDNVDIHSMVYYYPFYDVTRDLNQDMKRKYGRGFGFDSRLWNSFIEAYQGKTPTLQKTLPPTLVISAERDIIADEAESLKSSSSEVTIVEFSGALHGFLSDRHQKTAFEKAVDLTDMFVNK